MIIQTLSPRACRLLISGICLVVSTSCSKQLNKSEINVHSNNNAELSTSAALPYCREDVEDPAIADTILRPTILGTRLVGLPYSVSIMRQAAVNLLGSSIGINENALYVRFRPSNSDQLALVEDMDIDLFDYPLDYEIAQEGDYYNDGISGPEDIPWLYAVVSTGFNPPAGVTYEILQRMHVPDDYRIENEAFRLTGNNLDTAGCAAGSIAVTQNEVGTENCDCRQRESALSCDCRITCGFNPCRPDPLPSPVARIPVGTITVQDDVTNTLVAIRNARMVARRFLKVQRVFTDQTGSYRFTKSFRNKVTILLKFKNGNATIRGIRGARLWQALMPVKINLGRFRGNLNNIVLNVGYNGSVRTIGARRWAAATTHNAVQEYRLERAPAEGIGLPPDHLKILIVPGTSAGSAPMFERRANQGGTESFVREYLLAGFRNTSSALLNSLLGIVVHKTDITIGYVGGDDVTTKTSDHMAETSYHELAHASHFMKVGSVWYGDFVTAEINEISSSIGTANAPYGPGNNGNSPIIALGESWAYYTGHAMTARKYGALSGEFAEQNETYSNNSPVLGLNSNLNLLEDFNPTRTSDPFRWIPQGLYYDLFDNRNDFNGTPRRVNLVDMVSSYNNNHFFNALDQDVRTLGAYRSRLLLENNNRDAAGVTTIFAYYGF